MSRLTPAVRSRGYVLGEARARRMTTAAAICAVALTAGFVKGPRRSQFCGMSKVDIAELTVKKYAFEAYPQWAGAHPARTCPTSLADLNEYMNNKDIKDPWGTPYKMYCGQTLPPGAKGLAVSSAGEDQKEGTEDDVKSW